ncbi:MAG: hypothetical protein WAM70_15765 [Pyrinomonadaceae bacterium]
MIEALSSESVPTVAERYRQQGYDVVFEPDPSLLPKEAKSLHPDFLATKEGERVIVEVKYSQNLLAYPALMRLAEDIRRLPGWRLDVVILEQPTKSIEPQALSVEHAKRRLEGADRVAETGDYGAGLLLLWTAAESVLRDHVRRQADETLTSTSRLPKLAYSLGLIGTEDAATAEWMTRIRNDVVHGRTESSVSKSDYDRAKDFVIRLLKGDQEIELLAS